MLMDRILCRLVSEVHDRLESVDEIAVMDLMKSCMLNVTQLCHNREQCDMGVPVSPARRSQRKSYGPSCDCRMRSTCNLQNARIEFNDSNMTHTILDSDTST